MESNGLDVSQIFTLMPAWGKQLRAHSPSGRFLDGSIPYRSAHLVSVNT